MIVVCDRCHAKYQYDEERFDGRPAKRLRCSKCHNICEVVNPRAFEAGPALGRRPPPDETVSRHTDRRGRAPAATPRPTPALALPPDQKLSLAV
ncbi:MAG: zinc-ribbon domain-containing protein, partial [Syntrophomonadaceae bacterium]